MKFNSLKHAIDRKTNQTTTATTTARHFSYWLCIHSGWLCFVFCPKIIWFHVHWAFNSEIEKSTRISTTSNDIQFNIICAWCANYCAFQTIFVILSRLPCAKQQLQFFCHNTFFVQNEVENLPLQRVDSEIVVYIDARVPVRCPNWCVIILLCSTII